MKLIECNKAKSFGQPSLVNTRLTVFDIVSKVYYEESIDVVLSDYFISLDSVKAAINYCRNLNCQKDKDLINFCEGCLLDTLKDGWSFSKNNYTEENIKGCTITISLDEKSIFLGSLEELENLQFGKVTWLIAEYINKKYFG